MGKENYKVIRLFLSLLIFFYAAIIIVLILSFIVPHELNGSNVYDLLLVDTVHSFIICIIIGLLYKDSIKDGIKKIKDKNRGGVSEYIRKVIIGGLTVFVLKIMVGMVVLVLTKLLGLSSTTVENQQIVENMLKSAPAIMMISSVIFAPLTEELLFRAGIYDLVKNKKVYIAVSGLIFGLMHVTDSVILLLEILLLGVVISSILKSKNLNKNRKLALSVATLVFVIISYAPVYYLQYGNLITKLTNLNMVEVVGSLTYIIIGMYFAKVYTEDENIMSTIGIHAFNNFVSMLLII